MGYNRSWPRWLCGIRVEEDGIGENCIEEGKRRRARWEALWETVIEKAWGLVRLCGRRSSVSMCWVPVAPFSSPSLVRNQFS